MLLLLAKVQLEVASYPMTSEYVSANNACKSIMHARQLSEQLGWSQPATPFMLDNKTSINLATAPEITRKAKHILQYHHYIRDLYRQRLLRFLYVASSANRADVLTKLFSRTVCHFNVVHTVFLTALLYLSLLPMLSFSSEFVQIHS